MLSDSEMQRKELALLVVFAKSLDMVIQTLEEAQVELLKGNVQEGAMKMALARITVGRFMGLEEDGITEQDLEQYLYQSAQRFASELERLKIMQS